MVQSKFSHYIRGGLIGIFLALAATAGYVQAQVPGGVPSFLRLQALGVGTASGSTIGNVNASGTITGSTVNASSNLQSRGLKVAATITCTTSCSGASLAVGDTLTIGKGGNTTRNSTSTLADDPDLTVTGLPSGTYQVTYALSFSSSATADVKGDIRSSSDPTPLVINQNECGGVFTTVGNTFLCNGGAGETSINIGTFKTSGSNNGTIAVEWAQNTLDASNTTLENGSWLRVQRME